MVNEALIIHWKTSKKSLKSLATCLGGEPGKPNFSYLYIDSQTIFCLAADMANTAALRTIIVAISVDNWSPIGTYFSRSIKKPPIKP